MAQQRKSPPTAAKKAPAGKSVPSRPAGRPAGRPPAKKPGKSIVNQKQTPWGLIATTVVLVLFAGAIVIFAVTRHHNSSSSATGYTQPELAAAKQIQGMIYKKEPNHTHVAGTVNYDTSPPIGGNHSPTWADCSGTVYAQPIANENAVHMLEHGAVWITYNAQTLPAGQLATLQKLVSGVDRMALSPYPNLKTNISLQSWDYQLFVDSASDPRIQQFISALKYNPATTPEPSATCSDPGFKASPSTFGHPS